MLTVFLPPLSLKMKSDQTLKYIPVGIVAIPLLHLLFLYYLAGGYPTVYSTSFALGSYLIYMQYGVFLVL